MCVGCAYLCTYPLDKLVPSPQVLREQVCPVCAMPDSTPVRRQRVRFPASKLHAMAGRDVASDLGRPLPTSPHTTLTALAAGCRDIMLRDPRENG